jgi:hypothetical protein
MRSSQRELDREPLPEHEPSEHRGTPAQRAQVDQLDLRAKAGELSRAIAQNRLHA